MTGLETTKLIKYLCCAAHFLHYCCIIVLAAAAAAAGGVEVSSANPPFSAKP